MFKLQHVHRAINCATGATIKLNNLVNLLLTNETISLAFEEDRLVIVSNGNVVFFTTTSEYSAEVHEFLQKQKLVRSLRKEVKDIEKQLKTYLTPDLPGGDKMPSFLVEEPICVATLKRGDLVKLRDSTKLCVSSVTYTEYAQYPYRVHFTTGTSKTYLEDGRYSLASKTTEYDIVEVTCK